MRRLVIAVDCDDVLVRTTPFFVNAYNKKYGTHATLADARKTDSAIWGDEESVVLARWVALMEEPEYRSLAPDAEEVRVLQRLAQQHELHLVTARKPEEREATQALLDRELPAVFTSLEFVGWTGSKGQVTERMGADVLIDDNASHLHDALRHGLASDGAILFGDYAWSDKTGNYDDLTHCFDWPAVEHVIAALANKEG